MTSGVNIHFGLKTIRYFFFFVLVCLFPSVSFATEAISVVHFDLKHQFVGYIAVAITVIAYIIAMTEDVHLMKKS